MIRLDNTEVFIRFHSDVWLKTREKLYPGNTTLLGLPPKIVDNAIDEELRKYHARRLYDTDVAFTRKQDYILFLLRWS